LKNNAGSLYAHIIFYFIQLQRIKYMKKHSKRNRNMALELKASYRTVKITRKTMRPVQLKIAYVGGGSVGWAWLFMNDLAKEPNLSGEVALYDIDYPAAKLNEAYGNLLQSSKEAKTKWRYKAYKRPHHAFKGADFVIMSIQPGTFDEMEADIKIPEKYGLIYPVGDTTGAAGLIRALRTVPIYEEYAHMIKALCPRAWIINYTNPMSVCTRTLTKVEPSLKVFGCCHEVFGTQSLLGRLVAKHFRVEQPTREQLKVNVIGINHFTWINRATWQGHDLLPLLRKDIKKQIPFGRITKKSVMAKKSVFASHKNIAFELFHRYGILAAAGDRHLAEFVPGFLITDRDVFRWGIRKTPVPWRRRKVKRVRKQHAEQVKSGIPPEIVDSGEEGVYQIMALLGLTSFTTNVNVENRGQISNLPKRVCVETNARFSKNSITPVKAGPIPENLLGLMSAHIQNQEMIIDAALERDRSKAFITMFNDPTVTIPVDKAYKMFGEMVRATRKYLPGWKRI
jgi:alpha-galactosidase